jgi:hypothetical protein
MNLLLECFPHRRPVRANAVHSSDSAKEDVTVGTKFRLPAFDIRDPPRRRSPVKRHEPQSRLPFTVRDFHHDLLAVGGDVRTEREKARSQ